MRTLLDHAAALNIRIEYAPLVNQECAYGLYLPNFRTILLDNQLPPELHDFALAHELGHAFYDHQYSTARAERKADKYALQLLISAEDYAAAEQEADGNKYGIAALLRVPPSAVAAYQETLSNQPLERKPT
ncbi:ImmA/IrrE family metallo-endopeptidase [Leucobacter sp. OH1287]|uniref:ImmA/IrrE family metallo-endopeptidase n=1 Tax=Leucobacter sp. OH1287 TaxID=2491049 RepID=UPI000F6044FF|nr:ImmA/IrrE family metallo-endopeptidase [Leucobacter sp. OH1287]RRD61661.1 ImmA/IrrE family metallo-endopeptidase [Leucobacter sp. OH1287]